MTTDKGSQQVVCVKATDCKNAFSCSHGTPHTFIDKCSWGTICYDYEPPSRAYCNPVTDDDVMAEPGL